MSLTIVRPTPETYKLDDPFSVQRWMCPNCGLVFDFQFGEDGFPGWPESVDEVGGAWKDKEGNIQFDEPEVKWFCSRCTISFDENELIPVTIAKFELGKFSKITFIVEDAIHEIVVKQIANHLKKDIDVTPLGNSPNVKSLFTIAESKGTLARGYFVIDGDNQSNPHPDEPNFIHLEKYCMENYLLDVGVCAAISRRTRKQIRTIILESIKSIIFSSNKDHLLTLLFARLSSNDITEESLMYVDASKIFPRLIREISMGRDDFVKKYVSYCHSKASMDTVLPARIVEIIRAA